MLKRLGIYLNEMFPITAFVGSIISALAVQLVYLRLYEVRPSIGISLFIPGLVLTFISLLIRIMDEFKDYQDDLTNFPDRPLPSGRVKKSDLGALACFCVLSVIFLSSTSMPVFIWGITTLGFTGLMYKWFFIEEIMRKNLPLAFITHHPIVIFNFIYLIISCMQIDPRVGWEKWPLIIPICLIYTNWEIMRKIRSPKDETAYTTYSKIFGPRVAILIAIGLQLVFSWTMLRIFMALNSPIYLQVVFFVIQGVLSFSSLRFLFTLKMSSPLRTSAEGQILLVLGFLLGAALL
jgi:4-hydroxybenzoate polyprenyltransferase